MAINYSDILIHTKKSGQKLKKFRCTCDSCGSDRGYLPKSKAFTVCLPCKRKDPTFIQKHQQAIKAVRSSFDSREKTKKQMSAIWDHKRNDPVHILNVKIKKNIRSRLSHAVSRKSGSAVKDLGCSIEEFRTYISSLFQGAMSWDNYGKSGWELDHIVPLVSFDLTDPEQLRKACHYSNLQPLWKSDNRKKGSK